jgi:hypothetical protein
MTHTDADRERIADGLRDARLDVAEQRRMLEDAQEAVRERERSLEAAERRRRRLEDEFDASQRLGPDMPRLRGTLDARPPWPKPDPPWTFRPGQYH